MTPVLADTGFLIALFDPQQKRAGAAARYLQMHRHPLATVSATIVESCFFLTPAQKMAMLTWIRRGGIAVLEVPVNSYAQLEITLRKYADQDIGFADAALMWLASKTGANRILTVDRTDFETFRLKGGKRFELIDWY